MVVVQKMTKKPATVVTNKDFCERFYDRLVSLTRDYNEVILEFDNYKTNSLKHITRKKETRKRSSAV